MAETSSDESVGAPAGACTLRAALRPFRARLGLAYLLLVIENVLRLLQPLALAAAVNGVLNGSARGLFWCDEKDIHTSFSGYPATHGAALAPSCVLPYHQLHRRVPSDSETDPLDRRLQSAGRRRTLKTAGALGQRYYDGAARAWRWRPR